MPGACQAEAPFRPVMFPLSCSWPTCGQVLASAPAFTPPGFIETLRVPKQLSSSGPHPSSLGANRFPHSHSLGPLFLECQRQKCQCPDPSRN